MQIDQLANLAVTVLSTISTLVIVSLGLAVIFGMMRIINLAHGEFIMLGAFAVLAGHRAGLNLWLAMLAAPLVVGAIGLVIERLVIRHLYGRILDTMLATWGLSLVLVQGVVIVFGPSTQGIATPLGSLRIGSYSVSQYSLFLILMAVVLAAITYVLFTRTPFGIKAQAAAQLPEMASTLGIHAARINMITFSVGAALAGAAGALLAPMTGVVPSMGLSFVAKAFMTVVVGGPVILSGSVTAATFLGSIDSMMSYWTTPFFGQGALLLAAIILLRLMPEGFSGNWKRQV